MAFGGLVSSLPTCLTYLSCLNQIRCWKLCALRMPSPPCHRSHHQSIMNRIKYKRQQRLLYRSTRSIRILPHPPHPPPLCRCCPRSQRPRPRPRPRPRHQLLLHRPRHRPIPVSSSNNNRYVSRCTSFANLLQHFCVSIFTCVRVVCLCACVCVCVRFTFV